MGWYIRKAFSAGPVRLNLSKSGLGLSFGAKGARIGAGPRGLYTHFGRGGLYYRSSHNSSSDIAVYSKKSETYRDNSFNSQGALFDDKQINPKKLALDFSFKISRKKEWLYLYIGILFLIIAGYLTKTGFNRWISFSTILGIFMFSLIILRNIKYWILKRNSDRFYDKLKNECCRYENDDFKININKAKEIIEIYKLKLDEGYFKRAGYLFYRDYLNSVISDCRISNQEKDELGILEDILNLDKDLIVKIKRYMFNKAYLIVVKDKVLTKKEENEILQIKDIFSLNDNDVKEELETLRFLKEARRIGEENLNPINVSFTLNKNEICYHQTRGRIIKEKILRSYQRDGVRRNIKGLVAEKDGDLYLTSQRIVMVGEGVYNIKLEKIFSIETDLDENSISMNIDGRKSSIILTVPDSLIFSAKLNKLRSN
jgi:hypothetical protein